MKSRYWLSVLTGSIVILMFITVFITGIGADTVKADRVLKNGVMYTMDKAGTVAEALAIKDGRIIFVGSTRDVSAFVGPATVVMDLEGKTVFPGMIETHLHPPGTADADLFSISLFDTMSSLEGMLEAIKDFVETHPDLDLYFGSGFSTGAFSGQEVSLGPKKEHLDAISPNKPIFLVSYDGHIGWVNSAALRYMGLTKNSPDPEGGRIERNPVTGELWGSLKEAAANLMPVQELSLEQRIEAMELFQERMHSWGYTAVQNMSGRSNLPELKALEEAGRLKLRVRSAVALDPEADLSEEFALLEKLRREYTTNLNTVSVAKFFADGVVEGVTAFLLEPYEEAADQGADYYGEFLWDLDKMKEAFVMAHRKGFQIHVHSIGDASTRNVLDCLEYAGSVVAGDFRPTITHNQLVAPVDIPRFASLGVVASTQAGFWGLKEPDWWEVVDYPFLGERAEHEYPLRSFFDAGAVVVSSSDHWVTPIPNPLWAMETGVTRNLNNADYYGVPDITDMDDPTWLLNPSERTTLVNMVKSYTSNGAYAVFMEDKIGTLEVGKYADMVILEEDIFKIDPLRIDSVKLLATIFNGEVVFEAE